MKSKVYYITDAQDYEIPILVVIPDNVKENEIASWLAKEYGSMIDSLIEK